MKDEQRTDSTVILLLCTFAIANAFSIAFRLCLNIKMYDIYQRPRGYNKGGRLRTDVCPTITESDWQQNCFLIEEFS